MEYTTVIACSLGYYLESDKVFYQGFGGCTIKRMAGKVLREEAHVRGFGKVVILLGTIEVLEGRRCDITVQEMRELVQIVHNISGCDPFVCLVPPIQGFCNSVGKMNAAYRKVFRGSIVNLNKLFLAKDTGSTKKELFCGDGLHLSAFGIKELSSYFGRLAKRTPGIRPQ